MSEQVLESHFKFGKYFVSGRSYVNFLKELYRKVAKKDSLVKLIVHATRSMYAIAGCFSIEDACAELDKLADTADKMDSDMKRFCIEEWYEMDKEFQQQIPQMEAEGKKVLQPSINNK